MLTTGFRAVLLTVLVSLTMAVAGAATQGQNASIGGLWTGVMRDASGAGGENTLRFSARGYPVYGYVDSRGYKEVELTTPGQTIQYVPRGGGVISIAVEQVSGSATRAGYVINWSFERASNGYMDQNYKKIAMQCELQGGKLAVVYQEAGSNRFGDASLTVGGPTTTRLEGVLERAREQ